MQTPTLILGSLLILASMAVRVTAQLAPPAATPTAAATPKPDEEPVELSPFVVTTDKDVGYLAANTAAGSRLNTALIDTPASISELTKEFLTDINAYNVMDAVEFSLGFQTDRPGGNDNLTQFQSQTAIARGLGRSRTVSRDYFPWDLADDAFSIERLSESRGPNAILFGVGAAGGIINTTSKRAMFKNAARLGLTVEDTGGWRSTLDVNRKLSNTLALRLNVVKDDLQTWRELEYTSAERIQLAGTWRPFKRTEVRVEYERGLQDRLISRRFSSRDFITPYLAAGAPAYDRTVNGNTYPTGVASLGTNPRLVFDGNAWSNWQRFGTSARTNPVRVFTDEKYVPFTAGLQGPTSTSDNNMRTASLVVQQEVIKNLFVEVGLNENASERLVFSPVNQADIGLNLDPNVTVPAGATPHLRQYFIEGLPRYDYNIGESHNRRALATYEWNSANKWVGAHRFVTLATQNIQEGRGRFWLETNLTPLNPAVPNLTNAQNTLVRRTYLSQNGIFGDNGVRSFNQDPFSSTQPAVAFSDPVNALSGRITPGWVLNSDTPTRDDNRSLMFAGQSKVLKDRLVITWGVRKDTLDTQSQVNTRDPSSNAIVSSALGPKVNFSGRTESFGAVVPIVAGISLYGNKANNFSPQSVLDINKTNIGNVKGEGHDYGIKFNLSGNRLYLRAGVYESAATRQSKLVFTETNWMRQIWEAIEGTAGPHYVAIDPTNNVFDTIDTVASGEEFEVTANPFKGVSLTANYASLRVEAANNIPITLDYVNQHKPQWTAADPSLPVPSVPGRTLGVALQNLNDLLVQDSAQNGREAINNYRYSFNFFGRYQFQGERLKGWGVGGGYRYRNGRIVNYTSAQEKIWAPSYGLANAYVEYRRKIWSRKVDLTLKVNVANLFDNQDLILASTDVTGQFVTGYSFQTPRLFAFSADFAY